jgi:hypothetical protein
MGVKGFIQKTIQFSRIDYNFYNLAFGDMDNQTGRFYDNVASGNNDHEKILATVAAVVESFTVEHPTSFIYAKGSTPSRTRLYRICINKYWTDITTQFTLFGLKNNNNWQDFTKDQPYNAFLGTRNHSKY